jgi:hypothetical protein
MKLKQERENIMQRIPAWPTGIASHIIPSSCGTLDRQRVANEAPRPGGWRGAARERCLATLARIARQGRDKRARASILAPPQRDAKHHKWGGGSSGLSKSGSL